MASKGTKPNSAHPRVKRRRTLPSRTIREIVRRVVEVAQPQQITVFGSVACDEMRPNSDVDLWVVKANVHRRQLAKQIYRRLIGVGQAVDVIVVTPDDLERCRNSPALIISPTLREGKVVHAG